ncbi:MAG: ATP-dependent DNA helicase RecG [Candidatus Sungbacteria bacterium]|uniref:ATP-dependent DNA helicase RecG n=1 Tax=Candidatus Sungiibacteriota bacterium TaxID=2750080 RepID=A0A9D6DPK6_9BACT|nr:ATP-dependent DNA helicase RecG [Candidatus Sungbacteria bacterium]
MFDLDSPIETLGGIGEKVLEKLRKLKIKKVRDLLFYLPFRYEDFSNIKNIADLAAGEKATVTAKILNINNKRTWKRKMIITEALLEDATAPIRAVWFHQPYLLQTLKKGLWVNISGKVSLDKMGLVFSNPVFEVLGSENQGLTFQEGQTLGKVGLHTGGLVAIYPETQGLTSRWLRLKIKALLDNVGDVADFLPNFIAQDFELIKLTRALRQIHFPKNNAEAQEAKKRLAFQDIFLLQLYAQNEKQKIKSRPAAGVPIDVELIKKFTGSLPFRLTDSQKIASWQILKDMEKPSPMNRLLVGDVGSGKTVVAALAALNTASQGYQTAFLAPTEILAFQHYKTASQLFADFGLEIGLLTASQKPKSNLAGFDILIGTHALIQKSVRFSNLALVVVDEQHRFGVDQRAALLKDPKHAAVPHLLSMSATPIPRTLALTLYGDLDLSLLKEMPKGRKKIITKVVAPANREKAYDFIENQIKLGRQAFVICPLIEESETAIMSEVKNATAEYEKLSKNIFPHLKIGLLHGRLKPLEKEEVMKKFKSKKTDILVSTSVVEVGIDVPNASVMMIEGADRFGLSQLHQFRGRVGRAEHQSYCFLFTESPAQATAARLKILAESEDGFRLAEKDLELRGPGQFFGREQSGLPDLAMSSLKDTKLIVEVQQAVKTFLEKDKIENHALLKDQLGEFKREIHWE